MPEFSVSQLDAIRTQRRVQDRLVSFLESFAYIRDGQVSGACRRIWSGPDGVTGTLWVEPVFPAQSNQHTLQSLTDEDVLSAKTVDQIVSTGVFPKDRPLYQHQEEALRRAAERDGP